jgi:hypothetical protein
VVDLHGCGVCKSSAHNRNAGQREETEFWAAKGIEGRSPEGMQVRSVIVCTNRLNLPARDVCGCMTAWVRDAADDDWRAVVKIPSDFVASVAVQRS